MVQTAGQYFEKDLLTLIVTGISVLVAIITIIISIVVSKKYMDQIAELEHVRRNFDEVTLKFIEIKKKSETTIAKLELGFEINASIISRNTLKEKLKVDALELANGKWRGKDLSNEKMISISEKIGIALAQQEMSIEARRLELLCLSSSYPTRLSFARYLCDGYGDVDTIVFFDRFIEFFNGPEKIEYAKLQGSLESRLHPIEYDARRWIG